MLLSSAARAIAKHRENVQKAQAACKAHRSRIGLKRQVNSGYTNGSLLLRPAPAASQAASALASPLAKGSAREWSLAKGERNDALPTLADHLAYRKSPVLLGRVKFRPPECNTVTVLKFDFSLRPPLTRQLRVGFAPSGLVKAILPWATAYKVPGPSKRVAGLALLHKGER